MHLSLTIMRQKRLKNKHKALISNAKIADLFMRAIDGISYRECAQRFNNSALGKDASITVTKDLVWRVATGDFVVVNERIKKLCEFMKVDIYEQDSAIDKPKSGTSSVAINYGIRTELQRVADLAKSNPTLEGKLSNLLRGISEIVSAQGTQNG